MARVYDVGDRLLLERLSEPQDGCEWELGTLGVTGPKCWQVYLTDAELRELGEAIQAYVWGGDEEE